MTKKDFELIARVIKSSDLSKAQREIIADEFAGALIDSNPRFNATLFVAACESDRA